MLSCEQLCVEHDRPGEGVLVTPSTASPAAAAAHSPVELQDVQHLLLRLLAGGEGGVALLPQELAAADEGRGVLELPAHHVGPLVQAQRQVAVAADPLREVRVHHLQGKREGTAQQVNFSTVHDKVGNKSD